MTDYEDEEARCVEIGHKVKELYGDNCNFIVLVIDDQVHFTSSIPDRKTMASMLRKAANIVEFADPTHEGLHQ